MLLTLQKQIIKKNLVLIRLACKLTGGTKVQQQRRDFLQSAIVQLNLKKVKAKGRHHPVAMIGNVIVLKEKM